LTSKQILNKQTIKVLSTVILRRGRPLTTTVGIMHVCPEATEAKSVREKTAKELKQWENTEEVPKAGQAKHRGEQTLNNSSTCKTSTSMNTSSCCDRHKQITNQTQDCAHT
jgi:hypothetical protein